MDRSIDSVLADAVPPAPAPPAFGHVWRAARRRALRRRLVAGIGAVGAVAAIGVASASFLDDAATRDAGDRVAAPEATRGTTPVLECDGRPSVATVPYASRPHRTARVAAERVLSSIDADRARLDSGRFRGTERAGAYAFSSDDRVQVVVAVERDDAGWRIAGIHYCAAVVDSASR
ncbi:MAG TPA: hypothetical protein VHJ34_02275 [Actinomycetota bacterium]|nr:hypothetical protein [Actinomycetota bacterium]